MSKDRYERVTRWKALRFAEMCVEHERIRFESADFYRMTPRSHWRKDSHRYVSWAHDTQRELPGSESRCAALVALREQTIHEHQQRLAAIERAMAEEPK